MDGRPAEGVVSAALEAWAESGHVSRVAIEGGSMQPLLRPGDCLVIEHGHKGLRCGQVLACKVSDRILVHRLVRRQGSLLYLAGDNRLEPDGPISPDAVLGRVMAVESEGRQASLDTTAARAMGRAIALLVPLRRRRGWRRLPSALGALNARLLRR